jgi:hypothetical protein
MLVETKKQALSDDAVGQARAYALWLPIVYYWVTDGKQIQVYLFQNAIQLDVRLMSFIVRRCVSIGQSSIAH